MRNWFAYCFFMVMVLFTTTISVHAQQVEEKTYMQTHTTSENYISLHYTRGGQSEKTIYYHVYEGQPVIALFEKGVLAGETTDPNQKLLNYIKENLPLLRYASGRQINTEKERQQFLTDYRDSAKQVMQLSIKTGGLHYNHFHRTSPEQIEKTRQQKLRNAYQVINSIIDQMESAATNGITTKR